MLADFMMDNVISLSIFFITVMLLYKATRRHPRVPPGPPCWPIIGNLASFAGLETNFLNIFSGLRKTYGDVCGLYLGQELTIILSGYDVIHGALVKRGTVFSKRVHNTFTELFLENNSPIVNGNGARWKELRTFSFNSLKELCFNRNGVTLEERVQSELEDVVDKIGSFEDPVDISPVITCSLANVMFSILYGRRVGYDNSQFNAYMNNVDIGVKMYRNINVLYCCFPFLHLLPGDLLGIKKWGGNYADIKKYLSETSKENIDKHVDGDRDCLIDVWLEQVPTRDIYHVDNLWSTLADLMGAGMETSATTIIWLLLYMSIYPRVQRKLHDSIDRVIRDGRSPSMKDKEELPYVEASVLEALRIGNIVPLAVPHSVAQDVVLNGFLIPKNSTILPNIASVHMDPELFPEPYEFKPERFLTDDEMAITNVDKLIPFSLGPRTCIGETVAKMELFLFAATLLQHFEFHLPEGSKPPSLSGAFGVTYRPEKFELKIVKRRFQ